MREAHISDCKQRITRLHSLNANLPGAYFGVPAAQVVEVGLEVEI